MNPPPFTMTIDVGPNSVVVISGRSLYELVKKMKPSGINIDVSYRIQKEMSKKSQGYKCGEKHSLLEGMVELDIIYPEEWVSGNRTPWYKAGLPAPPAYYFDFEK